MGVLGLDNFSQLNEEIGNAAGEEVISEFGRTMAEVAPDSVYRRSADEFIDAGQDRASLESSLQQVQGRMDNQVV